MKKIILGIAALMLFGCDGFYDTFSTLNKIEVDIPLNATFSPSVYKYSAECGYERQNILINVSMSDDKASLVLNSDQRIYSNQTFIYPLKVGKNSIKLAKGKDIYNFEIYRKSVSEEVGYPCPDYPLPGDKSFTLDVGARSSVLEMTFEKLKVYAPYLTGTVADSWISFVEFQYKESLTSFGKGYINSLFGPLWTGDEHKFSSPFSGGLYLIRFPLVMNYQREFYSGIGGKKSKCNPLNPTQYDYETTSFVRLFKDEGRAAGYRNSDNQIGLKKEPYVRRIRYWKLLNNDKIGKSASRDLEFTTTTGTTTTKTKLFLEAEVEGQLDLDFSSLSSNFMNITVEGSMSSVSLTDEQSFSDKRTINAIPGASSTIGVIWQLVEEFHIVDKDKNPFSDDFFHIDDSKSPRVFVQPLTNIVLSTTAEN